MEVKKQSNQNNHKNKTLDDAWFKDFYLDNFFFLAFLKLLLFSLLCFICKKKVSKLSWYLGLYISMCSTHILENPYGEKKKKKKTAHQCVASKLSTLTLVFSHTYIPLHTYTHICMSRTLRQFSRPWGSV